MTSSMHIRPRRRLAALARGALVAAATLAMTDRAAAQTPVAAYPQPTAFTPFRIANPVDEIALARSAAPASISGDAEVLILGDHGYQVAVKGKNGFTCIVLRAWSSGFDDPGFWNPKQRAPMCLNAAAVRSVLPTDLRRTEWALAGASSADMKARTKAAIAAGQIVAPEVGAMSYMMSKDGYLNDQAGHWHPHVMIYMPRIAPVQWGANLPDGPVDADDSSLEPLTVFFVKVAKWSDGTPAAMHM